MSYITLEEAHKALSNCKGIFVNDSRSYFMPAILPLTGEDKNCFMRYLWQSMEIRFLEEQNRKVYCEGGALFNNLCLHLVSRAGVAYRIRVISYFHEG